VYDSIYFERLETGNVFIKYATKDNKKYLREVEYNSTDNFKIHGNYDFPKKYLLDLFSLDNYELLEYLDENFTKYSGPKEYRDVPLLKKRE
jgi:hypothetical protein